MKDLDKIQEFFPHYYHVADKISNNSQKTYLCFFNASLILLLTSTIIAFISLLINNYSTLFNCGVVLSLLISSVLTLFLSFGNFQKKWYEGRAVAESLKTLSWKFVMKTKPFDQDEDSAQLFREYVKEIIKNHKGIMADINIESTGKIITEEMMEFRKISNNIKKDLYLKNRVLEQLNWYKDKCITNSLLNKKWSYISAGLQLIAILIVVIFGMEDNWLPSLIGIFATSSTSIISWMQVKRFSELEQAYSTTALELTSLYDKGKNFPSSNISKFVEEAEKAISREHTLWLARRSYNLDASNLKSFMD
jgi:ABC-type Fe3+-siderophore transport system permease subunit